MQSNDQWHYTDRTGAQAGPVSKAELQSLIAQGVAPSSGMAWTPGMDNWQITGQIAALQPAPAAVPAATAPTPAAADPYTTPAAHPAQLGLDEPRHYGGIGRLAYFVRNLLLVVGIVIAAMLGAAFSKNPTSLILIGAIVLCLIFYIRFAVQRIRNIGASAWWLLLMLVPLANNLLGIALVACPEGFAQHKKLDTTGIVLVVIFGGLFLLSFAANLFSLFA